VHYLIHAWDDPLHASLGLPAARAYIGIAPDAAHAQHMTTHIFLALGMWDEVVAQNTIAMKLQAELPGHYTSWLVYGLIQLGRHTEARELIRKLDRNLGGGGTHAQHSALGSMWAHYALDTGIWEDSLVGGHAGHRSLTPIAAIGETYAKGRAAQVRRDREGVQSALTEATRLAGVLREERAPGDPARLAAQVMVAQLTGLLHLVRNSPAMGLRALRAAAALEDSIPMEFGPPVIIEPSHELLGYVLYADDPASALEAFERADRMAPGRTRTLRGLAIAAYQARDKVRMRAAIDRLARNLAGAEPARRQEPERLRMMLEQMP
jgi:hypothetical protein